ncbi:methyltransferase domain-containing protein [Streptomyces sp. HNM0574]|uniref:methyltransferase domain-containing protein n=1 Tax=Streptomyces sp. HNM0574 TaxID=2714954 RepID=UPI00321648B4
MTGHEDLVRALRGRGAVPPGWADAVAGVDRGRFVPDRTESLDRARDPEEWARAVYDDTAIVTRTDAHGVPVSSSSMPSLMLEMLALLGVREGDRVLEIGTGTGYNAALLTHRLGEARVVSVESASEVLDVARGSLHGCGMRPLLVPGDGLLGHPERAPYDGIVATCTLGGVPAALLEQLADGGRLVTPYGNSFHSYSLLTLTKRGRGGTGRFSGSPAFMWAEAHRPSRPLIREVYDGQPGEIAGTDIDPRTLEEPDARWFLSRFVPFARPVLYEAEDGSGEATYWLLSDDARSWATVEYVPGREEFETEQHGDRRLWDEVGDAHARWLALGTPARDRFGLTFTGDGAEPELWLDEPGNPVRLAE